MNKSLQLLFSCAAIAVITACGDGGDVASSSGQLTASASRAQSFAAPTPAVPDTYNTANGQLTISTVQVGSTTFNNVVITIGSLLRIGTGPAVGQFDTYDSKTNQLTIPSVVVGSTTYNNVVITVGSVVSVGGNTSSNSTLALSGTISQGAPIAGATIKVIDANGTVVDGGTSGSDGSYSVADISSLTAPILITASANVGGVPITYRSLLAEKTTQNIANVTPITDAILSQTAGKSNSLVEYSASTELKRIDINKLNTDTKKVVTGLSNVLDQITAGTSAKFNPFTTQFSANGEAAADKVMDLVRITSTTTSSGMETELTDKSNTVGSVTISDNTSSTALPSLPQEILNVNSRYLTDLVNNFNLLFSTAASINSSAFADLFDSNFLENGLDKAASLNNFRTKWLDSLTGAKFSNPTIVSCNMNNICHIKFTIKSNVFQQVMDQYFNYDSSTKKFTAYGNHFKYKSDFSSSLIKSTDSSGKETLSAQIQFGVTGDSSLDWTKYKSATVTLQSGTSAPDLSYNFILKPNYCSSSISAYYDGMPLDDGTNNCDTWKQFDSNNQAKLKSINEKIKLGKYTAKFQAWTTSDRSGTPDVSIVPIADPILTTDKIGADGYPRVQIIQGSGTSLPYLLIDNADDFVVTGSLCITSASYCDNKNPLPHTTTSMQDGNIKLPSKIDAKASDGWRTGEKAKGYFLHVKDKWDRDIMVSKFNF